MHISIKLSPILLWGVCIFSAHAGDAAFSERALRENCSSANVSQEQVKACLDQEVSKSEHALQQAGQAVDGAVSMWDEEPQYLRETAEKLAASRQPFLAYRDKQCNFMASLSAGAAGHSHEIRRLACIAELNYRRAAQLQAAIAELPLKSPRN